MVHDNEGIGLLQVKHTMIPLVEDDRQHLIDNTDTQALTEERLRFVYERREKWVARKTAGKAE